MSAVSLTTVGLGLSAAGTVLLFLFGLPGVLSPYPKYANWLPNGVTKKTVDFRQRISWWGSLIGVLLILAGDLMQWLAVK
jgi:hypothetical protein